jgi:hypothetical protein
MPRLLLVAGSLAFSVCVASVSRAQVAVPAHISVAEGSVTVDRESGSETGLPDLPLVEGDRVRTEQGRAEILLGDGSALHLDAQTSVDINGASIVRLLGGRLVVFGEPSAAGALQVDAAPASVRLTSSGESRISLYDGGAGLVLDVAVVRGTVEVVTDGGTSYVQAGQRVLVEEGALPSTPVPFNSAQMDGFYRWSAELLDQARHAVGWHLPDELTSYASDFDNSGAWSYMAPYGYVWYPTVGTGWCPYSHGRWTHVGHGVGWSFVGNGGRWTYPTHHYGRWGMNASSGGWFWIPGRTWSSAWVQWAVSPGYVGWCPLGTNDRPVVGWGGGAVVTPYGHHGGPWRAWTVMPKTTFARGGSIGRTPIDQQALRAPTQGFVVQREAPHVIIPRVPRGTLTPTVSTTGSVAARTGSVSTMPSTPPPVITIAAPIAGRAALSCERPRACWPPRRADCSKYRRVAGNGTHPWRCGHDAAPRDGRSTPRGLSPSPVTGDSPPHGGGMMRMTPAPPAPPATAAPPRHGHREACRQRATSGWLGSSSRIPAADQALTI